jgi:hypothetical protein
MTLVLTLLTTLMWCAAAALLVPVVASLISLYLREQIRPQRPDLNALGSRSTRHALRLGGLFFDWLHKARPVFRGANEGSHVGRGIVSGDSYISNRDAWEIDRLSNATTDA